MRARRQDPLSNTLPPPTFPTCPGSPVLIDSRLEGLLTTEDHSYLRASEELTSQCTSFAQDPTTITGLTRCDVDQVTSIDTLPNDVLLEIFSSHLYESIVENERTRAWQSLVHVCRRWRSTVFGSPRHLNLQLICTTRTPARETPHVWSTLPLIILCQDDYLAGGLDNIVAALECMDRVCQIELISNPRSNFDIFLAAMQHPFPELTQLWLWSDDETALVSDSFLGGSAPRLEDLMLCRIPFLGLPKLLLSATHLVDLHLLEIPYTGYISPDTMATALFTLTSIESFTLEFQSPQSRPDRESRRLPPSTRFVSPVLVVFRFKGVSEYLNDLVAHIDAPQLFKLNITFFNDIVFNAPQLIPFISRTLTSRALGEVHIDFLAYAANVSFLSRTFGYEHPKFLDFMILCEGFDQQVSSLEKVFTSCLPPLSMSENLYIDEHLYSEGGWKTTSRTDYGSNYYAHLLL